jgi:hypothetical protein
MSYFRTLFSSQAHTLRLPSSAKADVERFVIQHQQGGTAEQAPFRRQLDFWAFSIATAVSLGLSPRDEASSKWGTKFADTRAVEMPNAVCDLLAMLALTELGPEHPGMDDPKEIIELGNRLAGAGTDEVLKHLKDPNLRLTALDKALEFAAKMHADMDSLQE